jgi:DNA-binding MarR family transcriptional regulator
MDFQQRRLEGLLMMRPEPERSLIASFTVARHELVRWLDHRLEETSLSSIDATILRMVLINRIVTVGAARSALALPFSTATEATRRLVEDGYATRQGHPDDRRLTVIRLTPVGRQVAQTVDATIRGLEAEILSEAHSDRRAIGQVVDAIELLAMRDRRTRLRGW